MNKGLIGLNAALVIAVAFLFYKVNNLTKNEEPEKKQETVKAEEPKAKTIVTPGESTPATGKIAFINIDVINEQSEEVKDLVTEAKRSKGNMEASIERLSMEYQKKMEEYQKSAKAGIAPESEMMAKQKEIMEIEKEAQNKQLQIDNFTMSINEKNMNFQNNLKNFLVKWNNGRYDFIFSYSDAVPTMLLGNGTLDVSKEVISQVNEEYLAKKAANSPKKSK
jgi:outer membrane protein